MSVSYPCEKLIRESENSLQCDSCETWIHVLNAIILILIFTKSFKTKLNHDIAFVAAVQYFLLVN